MSYDKNKDEEPGCPDQAFWERLRSLLPIVEGGTDLHIKPDQSKLAGVYLWINTYALDRFKERYLVVHKYTHYITVSLETFTILDGRYLAEFITEDMGECAPLKEVLDYLIENADQFRCWFDQYALGLFLPKRHNSSGDNVINDGQLVDRLR